jgi:aspartate/methionine/tyrosine aminotransferase
VALKVSARADISPFIVMDVMRAAYEREVGGRDVVHLEVGQPSTPAPRGVRDAAKRALDDDLLGYTDALGIPALRERIARHYRDYYGAGVDPGRVVVTAGSSGAFVLAFIAAFDIGDRVGIAAPGYPCYRNILSAVGVEPVDIPVGPETHFQLTPEIATDPALGLDGVIVASPSNPTGSMVPDGGIDALAVACERAGIRFVSDEIYHGITFGRRAETAAARGGETIVINSFSKYFSMTGWRLGWMVLPENLIRPVERLAQNLFVSPPTLSQIAAVAAFDCTDELDANVARYAANRDVLIAELPKAGFRDFAPADGAFYLYTDIAHMTNDSHDFCRRMLADTGVATTPGIDFDPARGAHFMRFSLAGSTEDMEEAARRLHAWLS